MAAKNNKKKYFVVGVESYGEATVFGDKTGYASIADAREAAEDNADDIREYVGADSEAYIMEAVQKVEATGIDFKDVCDC